MVLRRYLVTAKNDGARHPDAIDGLFRTSVCHAISILQYCVLVKNMVIFDYSCNL
jgi:hypothetical protein